MLEEFDEKIEKVLRVVENFEVYQASLNVDKYVTRTKEVTQVCLMIKCPVGVDGVIRDVLAEDGIEVVADNTVYPGNVIGGVKVRRTGEGDLKEEILFDRDLSLVYFWNPASKLSREHLETVKRLEESGGKKVGFVYIALDDGEYKGLVQENSYCVKGFGEIAEQGIEISSLPCCVFFKRNKVFSVVDPLSGYLEVEFEGFCLGKEVKKYPEVGSAVEMLTCNSETLYFDENQLYLLVFVEGAEENSQKNIELIQNSDIFSGVIVKIFRNIEKRACELILKPNQCLLIQNKKIVFTGSLSNKDILKKLKSILTKSMLSKPEFLSKFSELGEFQSTWEAKHPRLLIPAIKFTFSKAITFSKSLPYATEDFNVICSGDYLSSQKIAVVEYLSKVKAVFKSVTRNIKYRDPVKALEKVEVCCKCNEALIDLYYQKVLVDGIEAYCGNCEVKEAAYRISNESEGLDELLWGFGNFEVNVKDGKHVGVFCNGCENQIEGVRWKCAHCFDYDLCGKCYESNVYHQRWHVFIRVYE